MKTLSYIEFEKDNKKYYQFLKFTQVQENNISIFRESARKRLNFFSSVDKEQSFQESFRVCFYILVGSSISEGTIIDDGTF